MSDQNDQKRMEAMMELVRRSKILHPDLTISQLIGACQEMNTLMAATREGAGEKALAGFLINKNFVLIN